jgi:hypothetical protein
MPAARFLYRRLGDDSFVRFDSASDSYAVVPAAEVPHLTPAAAESVQVGPDKAEENHRHELLLAAMLEFQRAAHEAGNPLGAVRHLHTCATALRDPDALARLRKSRRADRARRVAAGRVLFGRHWPAAADWPAYEGPRIAARAARMLGALAGGSPVGRVDLIQAADHFPALSVGDVRRARALLNARWGEAWEHNCRLRDAIVGHVRALHAGR